MVATRRPWRSHLDFYPLVRLSKSQNNLPENTQGLKPSEILSWKWCHWTTSLSPFSKSEAFLVSITWSGRDRQMLSRIDWQLRKRQGFHRRHMDMCYQPCKHNDLDRAGTYLNLSRVVLHSQELNKLTFCSLVFIISRFVIAIGVGLWKQKVTGYQHQFTFFFIMYP